MKKNLVPSPLASGTISFRFCFVWFGAFTSKAARLTTLYDKVQIQHVRTIASVFLAKNFAENINRTVIHLCDLCGTLIA